MTSKSQTTKIGNDASVGRKAFEDRPENMASTQEFLRSLLSVEVGSLLQFDPLARQGRDPEGVHQLRVCARRLRSELRVVAPAMKSRPLSRLEDELQWVGRVLGQQRDLDVLLELLRSVNVKLSPSLDAAIFLRLKKRRASISREVVELLDSERYRRLVRTLADAVIRPPLRTDSTGPAVEILLPQLNRTLSKLFQSVDDLGPDPTNKELHRIRIMAKQGRYSAEVAGLILGDAAKSTGESLERVQSVLGELHDRVVAIEYLEEYSVLYEEADAVGARRAISLATQRMTDSIEELKTKWREPLERARLLSGPLMHRENELNGSGTQHEVQ